jgi:LysM repeat protein
MDKDRDVDMIELGDIIEKEPKLEESDFDERYDGVPRFFNLQKKTLFIGGAIVLVIITIVTLFSSGRSDLSKADFNVLIEHVDRIEARVTDIEEIEKRITDALQAQINNVREGATVASGTEGTMAQQLDLLARNVEALQQKMGSVVEEVQAIRTVTGDRVQAKKTQYHVVVRGESLYRIARKYGLTVDGLCKLNKITPHQSIYPGQKLLVSTAKDSQEK